MKTGMEFNTASKMKLCVVTNYENKGLINETNIFTSIYKAIGITEADTFSFRDVNAQYTINKNYSHLIISFDYKVSSVGLYHEFLREVTIPKIFIIDTIPEVHRKLNLECLEKFAPSFSEGFVALSNDKQNTLYYKHSDAFVFFSKRDKELFEDYYKVPDGIKKVVIPPPLGSEKSLKVNLDNVTKGTNFTFNGVPSYANGIHISANTIWKNENLSLDYYGIHGRTDFLNQFLINNVTQTIPKFTFKARLRSENKYFKKYSAYLYTPVYDTFDYYTFKSLLNGLVPIIGRDSAALEYLKNYPYVISNQPEQIEYTLDIFHKTKLDILKRLLTDQESNLKELSNENIYSKYENLIREL
jgi:hypothetical protein